MKLEALSNAPTSDATRSYGFVDAAGRRCVAWRRYDGTFFVTAEDEEHVDPVVKAIRGGSVSALREMVRAGADVTQRSELGRLPLHEAAARGNTACLEVLLQAHPETVDRKTLKEQTPLFLAVFADQLDCARTLLEWGADPDIADKDRETPLYKACERESAAMVAVLLARGAAVDARCVQGWTALHEAACRNNLELCALLVGAGAAVNPANMYGVTPLFVAAQCGHREALDFLVNNGANINMQASDGATPLYEACKNGHRDVVELLLSRKSDANKPTKTGLLPIHIAAQRGHTEIVARLVPVSSRSRVLRSGVSPLHLAAERDHADVLKVLISAGFHVNAKLSEERSARYQDCRTSALYFAAVNNNVETAAMLLAAGADPNQDPFHPLLVAARQGSVQMVRLLVERGADVDATLPTRRSPTGVPASLVFCVRYPSLLKYLLDQGCHATACFQCERGGRPHPPPAGPGRKDGLGLRGPEEAAMQFCDVISGSPGPVIDVLLDYVGNVQLCSRLTERLDEDEDWTHVKQKAIPPRSLKHLSRLKIREQVGRARLRLISSLPLPTLLVHYLHHRDQSARNNTITTQC